MTKREWKQRRWEKRRAKRRTTRHWMFPAVIVDTVDLIDHQYLDGISQSINRTVYYGVDPARANGDMVGEFFVPGKA